MEIEQPLLKPMQESAIEQGTTIISGLVVSEREPDRHYNSAVLLGAERVWYHKRHLVIFGEYYPMRWLLDLLSGLISIPYSDLTPGPREQESMRVGFAPTAKTLKVTMVQGNIPQEVKWRRDQRQNIFNTYWR